MKHLQFFVLFIASALLTTACGDDDKTQSGDFGQIQVPDVAQLVQMAEAGAGTSSVSFTTQAAWSASIRDAGTEQAPDWITISPDHGDQAGSYTVQITLLPNTGQESRTAFITVTCGSSEIEISVTQKAPAGSSEEDESQTNQPNGRLIRITEYENGKADYYLNFAYDEEGRLLSVKSFENAASTDPAATWEFAYEPYNSSKVTITETYYDKTPAYGSVWECQGGSFQSAGIFATIEYANVTDLQNPKSTGLYEFQYKNELLTSCYKDHYEDGNLTSSEEIHLVYDGYNCTRIDWTNGSLTQTYTYDEQITRHSNEYERLFSGYRGFNPGLCFIYESDMLRSLGMLGHTGDLLPVKVVTSWPDGTPVTETLTYKYYNLDGWQAGEERDGMEITLDSSEGSQLRYVLTFEAH